MTQREWAAPTIQIGRHVITLSNPGKELFANGITRRDLVEYYVTAAPAMIPLMKDRPVVMMRYPDGISGARIVQKNIPEYFPEWISRAEVPKREGGTVRHVICDNAAALAYLANQAIVEPHVFLTKSVSLERAQEVVFDLDPPGASTSFGPVRRSALVLRDLLESELGLTAFVKTTGGYGLHVHVPLDGRAEIDSTREFARGVAEVLVAREPGMFTTSQRIDGRRGLIYIDVMRNAYAQTVVAAYGVRARPGAPIAMPVSWAELADTSLTPGMFTLCEGGIARLAEISAGRDPWAAFGHCRYSVAAAQRKLDGLG